MNNNVIVSIENLTIHYMSERGRVKAVDNVSLNIFRGEVLGVIGESGSGKTTLALSILKLLPLNARIVSGKIIYYGNKNPIDILSLDFNTLREIRWKNISMVFQGAMNSFNPVMRIKDHFIETALAHRLNISREEIISRARELLEMVLLEPNRVLNSYPHQLSGGMRQRVLIALSLLLNPKVIILDEPTSALDVVSQKIVLKTLRNIKNSMNITMLFITHDLGISAEIADRIAVMYAGKIVEINDVMTLYKDPLHPYTQGLLKAIPRLRGYIEAKSIQGNPPDLVNPPPGCRFHPRCPFAMDICRREEPPMIDIGNGRYVSCWLYVKR